MKIAGLAVVVLLCWVAPVWAPAILEVKTVEHGWIEPGHSIGQVIAFTEQPTIPLVTILTHTGSSTVLYMIDTTGRSGVIVRCFNYGLVRQNGSVTIAVWD